MILSLRHLSFFSLLASICSYYIHSGKILRSNYQFTGSSTSDDVNISHNLGLYETEMLLKLNSFIPCSIPEPQKTEYAMHIDRHKRISDEITEAVKKLNLSMDIKEYEATVDAIPISDEFRQEVSNSTYYGDHEAFIELLSNEDNSFYDGDRKPARSDIYKPEMEAIGIDNDRILQKRKQFRLRGESLTPEQVSELFESSPIESAQSEALRSLDLLLQAGPPKFDGPMCPVCDHPSDEEELQMFGKCSICHRHELLSRSPPINDENDYPEMPLSTKSRYNLKYAQGDEESSVDTELHNPSVSMTSSKKDNSYRDTLLKRRMYPTVEKNSQSSSPPISEPNMIPRTRFSSTLRNQLDTEDYLMDEDIVDTHPDTTEHNDLVTRVRRVEAEIRELFQSDRLYRMEYRLDQVIKVRRY